MSTDERTAVPAWRRSRAALSLPADPSDEDLARDWTLSAADKVEIQGCRGDDNRLRLALQLCVLWLYGCFLPTDDAVPLRMVNHLERQLALPPMLLLDPVPRPGTDSAYQQRLREYLGDQPFGPDIQTTLEQQLTRHAQDGMSGEPLFTQALDKRRRALRRQAKTGLDLVLAALDLMLDPTRPPETARTDLDATMDEPTLRTAIHRCRMRQRLEDRGFIDELRAHNPHLKRYETITKWGLRRLLRRLFAGLHARIPPTKQVSEFVV
jgi:uncharacterized protein DUF4158